MNMKKKVVSTFLAAALIASSFAAPAEFLGSFTAFAAEEDNKMDFFDDGDIIDIRDPVKDTSIFYTENDEVQEALEKALLRVFNRRSLELVTYKDVLNVRTLNLNKLELTELPECIQYMRNLQTLNLSDNLLQSDALRALDLSLCTELKNVNLSSNYIDEVPRWARTEKITTRNLDNNFIKNENPRKIRVDDALLTHYYMEGDDDLDIDKLKDRILSSVTFDQKVSGKYVQLPDFLEYDVKDEDPALTMDTKELESFISGGEVKIPDGNSRIITLKIQLFNDSCTAEVRVYLLKKDDITTLNVQLSSLIAEYGTISKDKALYTETTWKNYENAYTVANAIYQYNKNHEDFTLLRNAFNSFNSAKKALTKNITSKEDTTISDALKALETVGKTYKEADYTPSSWAEFKSAYDNVSALLKNSKNVSETEAHTAIRRFLSAQSGLTSTSLNVPATAPKSDFERIYGENMSQIYGGTMLDGNKYTWTFLGKDITVPVDFKPEVQDTHASASDIMMETGSANGYRLFNTVQTGAFPGTATLELELNSFPDGSYYLYKWDTGSKRGKMQDRVTVENGKLTAKISEGGLYYISPAVRNFALKSTRFHIDDSSKTITIPLLGSTSVSLLRASMEFGSYLEITDENGDSVSNVSLLYNGMTVKAPGGDAYKIKTNGDTDNNGEININDVSELLEIALRSATDMRADINGDGRVSIEDVSALINYILSI